MSTWAWHTVTFKKPHRHSFGLSPCGLVIAHQMSRADPSSLATVPAARRRHRVGFTEDFRRFFLRGLAALLPTLITIWLLFKVGDFLWESLGRHLMRPVKWLHYYIAQPYSQWGDVDRFWEIRHPWLAVAVGIALA